MPPRKIFVAGHRGMVGSAVVRHLSADDILLTTTIDLEDAEAVENFFLVDKPTHVILAAAKVGGILANATYPVDFLVRNLAIQNNVLTAAARHGVTRTIFLGSSCVYPKHCMQPMREIDLMTGPLEETNRAYATAKLAGIELCRALTSQYGTDTLAVMPCNLYGPNDTYHATHSHVIPGLVRRFVEHVDDDVITVWGTGTPLREFLHVDDLARAIVALLDVAKSTQEDIVINVGSGKEISIAALAQIIADIVGFRGEILYDPSKPDGTPRKVLCLQKLKTVLPEWRPRIRLVDGLHEIVSSSSSVIHVSSSSSSVVS